MTYLILHQWACGCWSCIRCSHADDSQEVLFTGTREEAKAFLCAHWDD